MSNQFQDTQLTCSDCGNAFVFPAGEQRHFESMGFDPPKRCKPCRVAKKQSFDKRLQERPKRELELRDDGLPTEDELPS
jgi:hypothetical protein